MVKSKFCIELSHQMFQLAQSRLEIAKGEGYALVEQADALHVNWPSDVDVILAFYVLDIFSVSQIENFLKKAKSVLQPNRGRLVVSSITMPRNDHDSLSQAVLGMWPVLYSVAPILMGGCRPIQLTKYLSDWKLEFYDVLSVFGYTSEVAVALYE